MKTEVRNTIFVVYFKDIEGFKLVLVSEDAEGINSVKELGFVYRTTEAFNISRALEVVTGVPYVEKMVSKTEFINRFGKRIARVAQLVE